MSGDEPSTSPARDKAVPRSFSKPTGARPGIHGRRFSARPHDLRAPAGTTAPVTDGAILALSPGTAMPSRATFTEAEWTEIAALNHQGKSIAAQPKEPPFWVNGELARASGDAGSIPLIVLSAGLSGPAEDVKLEDREPMLRLHRALAAGST